MADMCGFMCARMCSCVYASKCVCLWLFILHKCLCICEVT
uniref:Uncharacterized protein n=1 Tax=Anguilla anguilla TaxID=7936 RepID=A0A0E9PES0_ANGAN